jgi:CheY-like chemotaxis protein
MTSVLVVDDDVPLGRALVRELRSSGYESTEASGYEEALQRMSERRYDVLLTDLRMGDKDGLDLILAIAESFPATRPILMSAYATARDSERAKELGAVRVLCKPFETSEMLQAVERAVECASGFTGSLHGLSLIDMLQMFHYGQRSVTIHVQGGTPAAIHLSLGQIVHASHGMEEGEVALSEILMLPAGSLQTSPLEDVRQTITRGFQPLMLDLLRRIDEKKRGGPAPGAAEAADLEERASAIPVPPLESDTSVSSVAAPAPVRLELGTEHERGLLADACRRTAAELRGDVVCTVVDLERQRLLGSYAARGDVRARGEALARATLALFRDAALSGVERLLPEEPGDGTPVNGGHGHGGQGVRRLELMLHGGQFLARATRHGRTVMALLLGRDADVRAARSQLDAVFPLVEALVP